MAYVRRATPDDVEWLGTRLRVADVEEIRLSINVPPAEALATSFAVSSDVWVACHEYDKPVLMFGVADAGKGTGIPWMLASMGIHHLSREFSRQCRDWVAKMLLKHERLLNYVHSKNAASIRWLGWCGFVIDPEPFAGREGAVFYRFTRERDV